MGLLVVGSVAYDSVETSADKVVEVLGGSATFFSMASSLFAPTYVVAVIGEDFREGVQHFIEKRPARFTGN
jgi:malate/lactate dehydrogenase